MFSIICDETLDMSRTEQYLLCVRHDLGVRERFLGLWHAKSTDDESLLELFNVNIPVKCDKRSCTVL